MKKKFIQHLVSTLLILSSTSVPADVPAKLIASTCSTCHGEKLPLTNQSQPATDKQLFDRLLAFKYDKQIGTIMNRISKGYTDTELKSVANYFSELN